ncbi:hypothetical protein EG347_18795 [Chryseobacterium sp. G0186]|uniref:hypothetical protein n=1 Tax=Chryseobacterium sp. G0186 TaxID=2487064 RepID=UPI000F50DFD1|nr:hypothetical protein [Chryseobacterium sp. G0186]AZA79401.1 hypothetical protein EG347_18795 [Chryseobacterium sp. G0186]
MSDISIIDEELAWMIVAALLSAAVFFLIFLYHVIRAYLKSNREKIRLKDTGSYGYILGGAAVMGFEFFCLLFLKKENNSINEIVAGIFSVVLFLSPLIIWIFGSYYDKSKKL